MEGFILPSTPLEMFVPCSSDHFSDTKEWQCHRYDFLVTSLEQTYIFFKTF